MNKISALINLLDDDDQQIATVAMEKLLQFGVEILPELRLVQEAQNPVLRSRIHRLEAILMRKMDLTSFIKRIEAGKIHLWEDLFVLNRIHFPDMTAGDLEDVMDELHDECSQKTFSSHLLCTYMKKKNFRVPSTDMLDSAIHMIGRIEHISRRNSKDMLDSAIHMIGSTLLNGEGSSLILCVIAKYLGKRFNWEATIILHKGHHCLIDKDNCIIDPQQKWSYRPLKEGIKAHACSDRNILLTLISNLYLDALTEGHMRILHDLAQVMAVLSQMDIQEFPYPIGDNQKNSALNTIDL